MIIQYGDQIISMVYQITNMKKGTLLFLILLMIAMAGALVLVNKNQDTRKGATFANTTLSVIPSEKIIKNVNETVSTQVWFYTENDSAKIDGVQAKVCYGKELSLVESGVEVNTVAGFSNSPIFAVGETSATRNCSIIVVTSIKAASDLVTTAKAMTLNFTAVSAGSGEIVIDKDKSMVTGDNSASATDKTLAITSVAGTTYEIKEAVLTGDEPILNYKVSFGGVIVHPETLCAVNWPVQIVVLSAGETKIYTDIPTEITSTGTNIEYKGSLALEGFNHLSNVAAFLKGPKHLQMKYAIQNQSGRYNNAGGELVLTRSAETSVLYNFSSYPMLAGDLVGATINDGPDGEINGVDFAYLKNLPKYELGAAGTSVKGDLDGNCMLTSNDVAVLRISLQEKQGELY